MAKRQSFADKAKKVKHVINCPKCNSPITSTLIVQPVSTAGGVYKYRKNMVPVCKCNYKEFYG